MEDLPPLLGENNTRLTESSSTLNTTTLTDPTMTPTLPIPQVVTQIVHHDSSTASIGIKLNGANYGVWSQIVEMFIAGKDKLGYLFGSNPQPPIDDPAFTKWRTENAIVKGWLINSMEPSLIGYFLRLPTAKEVWDAVARTYYDGSDISQVYDLTCKASRMRQDGRTVETYYSDLQSLWQEIDYRRPNPMKCGTDIEIFNRIVQTDRVYTLLAGLDEMFDKIRSDILRTEPLPSVEQTFAYVRREGMRQAVMSTGGQLPSGAAMVARPTMPTRPATRTTAPSRPRAPEGLPAPSPRLQPQTITPSSAQGSLFAARTTSRPTTGPRPPRPKPPVPAGGCTYCGSEKHGRDSCFQLHGYPDWWEPLKIQKQRERDEQAKLGQANLATSVSQLSLLSPDDPPLGVSSSDMTPESSGNCGYAFNMHNDTPPSGWIIDSGATDHMTYDPTDLACDTVPLRRNIINANGVPSPVTGAGTVRLTPTLSLPHTLLVPSLKHKLLSPGQATEQLNCCVLMYPKFCLIQDILTKEIIGRGTKRGDLYFVDDVSTGRVNLAQGAIDHKRHQIWLWHHRLGHPSFGYLQRLFPALFVGCSVSDLKCDTCILAKSHRVSYPLNSNKSIIPFGLVHSDVWGPSPVTTSFGIRWFVTFIDDCTRMTWLYLLKHKSDVLSAFKTFHTMVRTQFSTDIRILRSDNGGEYVNNDFSQYLTNHGILHETTCPQTPQQNGVAERKNRHLLETARSLLIGASVPRSSWDIALQTATYLLNRLPSKVLDFCTPLQVLATFVHLPSVLVLPPRVFGCVAFVHLHKNQRTKLDPCALRCIFMGYGLHQKGYRCYHPPSRRLYVTMDVTFSESEMYYPSASIHHSPQGEPRHDEKDWTLAETRPATLAEARPGIAEAEEHPATLAEARPATLAETRQGIAEAEERPATLAEARLSTAEEHPTTLVETRPTTFDGTRPAPSTFAETTPPSSPNIVPPNDHTPENIPEVSSAIPVDDTVAPTYQLPFRHNRGKPPCRYSPDTTKGSKYSITNYVSSQKFSELGKAFVQQISNDSIPSSLKEAISDDRWTKAMEEEMAALQKSQTWDLVPLPREKKCVGCRWVYTIKYKADGSIERYKARLVAKGYTQTYGVDYTETFAPVAKINTVRVLLSLAANLEWPLQQFDVKNAFLHGNLDEEVYMDIPPGYTSVLQPGVVCKLNKALYGLKQSPRAWFGRFRTAMRKYGFRQSNSDHTLFLKRRMGKLTALIIYVDDMIVTGDDKEEISRLKDYLATEFEMKDLGGLKYFLGIEVARSKRGIFLSQRKYVLDLLAETGMLDCKPADTPIVQNHHLAVHPDQIPTNKDRYQRLVGRLIYLSHTRPDIAYAVSVVSQFMHSPSEAHMGAVERILRYLKSSPGRGIMFSKNDQSSRDSASSSCRDGKDSANYSCRASKDSAGHPCRDDTNSASLEGLDYCRIEGYTDADWAGNITDRRSTSGYFTFVGGNLVTWRSKKQKVVALSSAEAEYRGMAKGVCEILWLRRLLDELGYPSNSSSKLFCDNKAAIDISHNPIQHDRTKHVEVDRHFIKEKLDGDIIQFPFVKSEDQLADILTKAVASQAFHNSLVKLGMDDIYAPT